MSEKEQCEICLKKTDDIKQPVICAKCIDKIASYDICDLERKKLKVENERYKKALERLSRLGNEPHLGNSIGNQIAQQALKGE